MISSILSFHSFSDFVHPQYINLSPFFNSSAVTEFDFSGLTSWTEATSLSQFVNAISSKDGAGKKVLLSTATNNALTTEQKNSITSKGWTIA